VKISEIAKKVIAWIRFSVYKDVFFAGVEENESLK
jgi:hypothetical protein